VSSPSQREGEDWGREPHLYSPPHVGKLQKNPKREHPLCILPLRKRRGLPPPNPPPPSGRGRIKEGVGKYQSVTKVVGNYK